MSDLQSGIQVILFDMDGTILDTDAGIREVMRTGFEELGLPQYEPWMFDVFREINESLWQQMERKEISRFQLFEIRWNRIFDALGFDCDGQEMEKVFYRGLKESGIPMAGAGSLLSTLSTRYALGVATNGFYDQQMNRLNIAGLTKWLTYFFMSERIGYTKPDPHFFNAALSEINAKRKIQGEPPVSPRNILMVGDSLTADMDGGIGYGMKTCFFDPHGIGTKGRQVDLVIHSLGELEALALRRTGKNDEKTN